MENDIIIREAGHNQNQTLKFKFTNVIYIILIYILYLYLFIFLIYGVIIINLKANDFHNWIPLEIIIIWLSLIEI
jgi:hypothetical protein